MRVNPPKYLTRRTTLYRISEAESKGFFKASATCASMNATLVEPKTAEQGSAMRRLRGTVHIKIT